MNEEQKKVIFICLVNPNFRLHYTAERQLVLNGQVVITPASFIEFINGKYITDDPEEIKYIRGCVKYRRGMIYEPTEEDRAIINPRPVNVRGAIASVSLTELEPPSNTPSAAAVKEKAPGPGKEKPQPEGPRKCKVCGKTPYTLKEDPKGRRLHMHEVSCGRKLALEERGVK